MLLKSIAIDQNKCSLCTLFNKMFKINLAHFYTGLSILSILLGLIQIVCIPLYDQFDIIIFSCKQMYIFGQPI